LKITTLGLQCFQSLGQGWVVDVHQPFLNYTDQSIEGTFSLSEVSLQLAERGTVAVCLSFGLLKVTRHQINQPVWCKNLLDEGVQDSRIDLRHRNSTTPATSWTFLGTASAGVITIPFSSPQRHARAAMGALCDTSQQGGAADNTGWSLLRRAISELSLDKVIGFARDDRRNINRDPFNLAGFL